MVSGNEGNAETGLDYFEVRYYSGAQGRFTSPDPLMWQDWQSGSDEERSKFQEFISNPQNFNLYAYVRNNPLKYTDPTGTYACNGTDEQCAQMKAAYEAAVVRNNSIQPSCGTLFQRIFVVESAENGFALDFVTGG